MSNIFEIAAALFGPTTGPNGRRSMSGETRQTAVVFDALSEGEIDGLVDGAASVYLDGTSLVDTDVYKGISAIRTTASVSAGSTTVTVAVGALDFADTTEGTRTILIKGAGKQGSSLFSGTAGGTTLTASSSWFTSGMASTGIMSEGASRLEIAGGGLNGKPYIGFISKYTSATSVEVSPPLTTTISGVTGGIDLVSQIASYNAGSNQVTTTTAATTTVSGVAATLSPPFVNANTYANTSPKTNFESINYAFRAGTEDQTPVQMLSTGSPTASFIHNPNTRLQQNNTYDGSNGVSDTTITAAQCGVPNPSETDQIKWVIECPQLFAISTKSGTEYNSWVEFTCDFEFSRDGGTSFTTVRLTGPTDTEILNRAGGYEYFNDQTSLSLHDGFIVNQTKKSFQEQYTHNIEQYKPFDTWQLVFKRVNEPNKPQSHHDNMNEAFLKYVEAQLTDRFTYPHTAYAALKYSAKDFSGSPKRSYHIRGKKIQVPTNYLTREEMDGDSPSYNRHITNGANQSGYQDWDGNFRGDLSEFAVTHKNHEKVYCNNPAWVFYDIITDPRYGLGDVVDADLVDKYALYQIARYCDELVDDGKGGVEPRFTCNAYINKSQEAYKVLKDLSSVFRGIAYWMDGQLVPVQDRPKEPIYTFSQGNVIDGEFTYEGTSERIRANQIVVKWNDPDDQYRAKSHIVDDVDNIVDKGRITSKSITAFGCTSEGQAHRIGKWRLITDKVETELCSFSTSINAGFVRPGDIINIQDQYLDSVQFSGRIKAGTSTTVVTLDRAVTLAANTTYELHLVYPTGGAYLEQDAATINSVVYAQGDLVLLDEDGAAVNTQEKASNVQDDNNNEVMLAWSEHSRVERQTITTSAGTIAAGANITVDTAFSAAPDSEVVWALTGKKNDEEVTGSAKQYRVMGIDEEGEGVYSIAASFYNDKKYDLVEKDYKLVSVPTSETKALATLGASAIDTFIPKPETITFSIQQVAGSDSAADNEESLTGTLEASIEWDAPIETTISSKVIANSYVNEALDASETTITLGAAATTSTGYGIIEKGTSNEEIIEWTAKSGNDITAVRGSLRSGAKEHVTGVSFTEMQSYETPYADLSNFEVEHTFHTGTRVEKFKREIVNGGETKLLISNALGGTHNVRVRSVSNGGQSSQWTAFENTIKAPGTVKATSKGNLAVGGTMSSPIEVTTAGAYNISNSLYSFTSASGQEYNISQASASHAQRTQSFSGLSASNGVGYSVFDTSASASDPWRALDQKTDTTFHTGGEGTAGSFTWWKDVGASNIGLTLATGTITVTANTSTITGSSTTFTSDFATGDMIRLGSTNDYAENTAAWYGYVDKVVSNTSLIVKGVVTKAFSSKFAYKQSFKPDFANDTIVSKITRTASTAYTAEHFGSVPGSIGADGEDGDEGVGSITIYRESASAPSTPSTGTTNPPTSWYSTVAAAKAAVGGDNLIWFSVGNKPAGSSTITWNTPIRYVEDYDELGGTKPPEDANKFETVTDSVEGRLQFTINGGSTTNYDVYSSAERTKLDRLRLGQDPSNAAASILNAGIALSASGALSGAGGGQLTKAGLQIPTIHRDDDPPTAVVAGELWVDTNDDNKLYRSTGAGNSSWVAVIPTSLATIDATRSGYADRAGTGLNDSGQATVGIFDGTTAFTAAEAVRVRGSYSNLSTTPLLNEANASTLLRNGTIAINTSGQLTGIGTGVNTIISNTKIVEADIVGSGKTFTGGKPNKVDIAAGTDGRISVNVDGAGAGNIAVFSTTDRQKLTNLRGGKVPGDGSGATTALIGNDEIGINTSTGVLSGIGTGTGSRVFNDVIGVTLDTTTNVGRITLAGVGTSNTTVDVTKSNLGLSYTDGATVGAVIGTNMFDTNGSTALGADDLKNGSIGLAADGSLTNIGTTQKVSNSKIASTDLSGTGKVFTSLPASGATVGAIAGTNLFKEDGSTGLGDDDIVTSAGTSANTSNVGNVTVTNAQNRLGAITNAGAWDGSTIATGKGGTGATNLNAVQNDRITTNANGTLNYDATAETAPSLASIAGIVGKASGGFGVTVADKTGAPYFSSEGIFAFGTIPAANGGTGLTSVSTLTNANVTTYEVNYAGFSGAWTNISGQIDPPAASFAITITWRNGAGTSLGTTVVTVSRNSNSTALLAATVASGGAHDSISLGAAASSGVIQTTTVTKNSVPVVLTASLLDGSGWGFK